MAKKPDPSQGQEAEAAPEPDAGHERGRTPGRPDLAVAAQLLGQPLDRVKDAATRCRPYLGGDGRTEFHSLAQLARTLLLPVGSANPTQRNRKRSAA